jgi:hypothetical protein
MKYMRTVLFIEQRDSEVSNGLERFPIRLELGEPHPIFMKLVFSIMDL